MKTSWKPWVVLAAAFIFRLCLLLNHRTEEGVFGVNMALKHAEVARNLLENGTFSIDRKTMAYVSDQARGSGKFVLIDPEDYPPTEPTSPEPYLGRMPGYPLLLAATWKFTGERRFAPVQLITMTLDALAALLVFLIGAALFGETAGLIAGLIYAFWAPVALLSFTPGHDSMSSFFNVLMFYFVVKAVRKFHWKWITAAGITLGVAISFRQDCMLIPVFMAIPLGYFVGWKRGAIASGLILALAILVNIPWAIRNKKEFNYGSFMPPTFWSGGVLSGIGDYPNPFGVPAMDEDQIKWVAEQTGGRVRFYNTPEFNNFCKEVAVKIIRENPLWYAKITIDRTIKSLAPTYLMWYPGPWEFNRDTGRGTGDYVREYPVQAAAHFGLKLFALLLWPLAILSLLTLPNKRWQILLLLAVPAYYWGTHIWLSMEYRYMQAGFWPLFLTAGAFFALGTGKRPLSSLFLFWKNK